MDLGSQMLRSGFVRTKEHVALKFIMFAAIDGMLILTPQDQLKWRLSARTMIYKHPYK
jgi:hypothetical protein